MTWSDLATLYERGRNAIAEETGGGLALCHLSHPTATGGCLYYTAITPQQAGREIDQWRALKTKVTEAFLDGGGTLSHHHGVGSDHMRWIARVRGPESTRALAAVKRELDPKGIMNPRKLFE